MIYSNDRIKKEDLDFLVNTAKVNMVQVRSPLFIEGPYFVKTWLAALR